jgi:hypothetical protein
MFLLNKKELNIEKDDIMLWFWHNLKNLDPYEGNSTNLLLAQICEAY